MAAKTKRASSDVRVIVGAALVITIIAILGVIFQPIYAPPLSVRSDEADGGMVLQLWFESLGYNVEEVVSDPIDLTGIDALFILNPVVPYTESETRRIAEWVRQGNLLIVAGVPHRVNPLLEEYAVWLGYLPEDTLTHALASPTLDNPPVDTVRTEAIFTIDTQNREALVHISEGRFPVLVSFAEGEGTVWVSGALRPFTNRGLSDDESARILVNLVAKLPPSATIGFDEAKHGFAEQSQSIFGWMVSTAPGWGLLSGFGISVVYLLLRGRRFGQPIPLPEARLRRESSEYIQALATLYRRSGQREDILAHYRGQLRRKLSERYALDPRYSDTELVKAVVFRDPSIDEAQLRDLLARLSQQKLTEAELIETVTRVDQMLRSLS